MRKIFLSLLSFLLLSFLYDARIYEKTYKELMSYAPQVEQDVLRGKEAVSGLPSNVYFEAEIKGEKVDYVLQKKVFYFYSPETFVTYSSSFYLAF